MTKILVTGATGLVGAELVRQLRAQHHTVSIATRRERRDPPDNDVSVHVIGAVDGNTDWRAALEGREAVVHLAGLLPSPGLPDDAFLNTNARGTDRLARQAAEAGVRTFVLASSIGAVTSSEAAAIIDDDTPPRPSTAYGRSKLEAEASVAAFAGDSERCGIVLRPPLVYGPRAGGSWGQLQRLASSKALLPFGQVHNRRTLVSAGNLASAFLTAAISTSSERSGAYAVTDGQSVSLADIVAWLREGMGRRPGLLPVPPALMRAPLQLAGRSQIAGSLFGNLEIDGSRFCQTFGWSPVETPNEAIRRSGRDYIAIRR
ncbi:NAD-dependent epimerase/dehydratase family protein [Aliihoeflea sp. PC F10.4]